MSTTAILAKNLSKSYKKDEKKSFFKDLLKADPDKIEAVKRISFEINESESVALLGPRGAGKTSVVKMLAGFTHPTSGLVKVLGFRPTDRKNEYLMRLGLVMSGRSGLKLGITTSQYFEQVRQIHRIPKENFLPHLDELTSLLGTKDLHETQIERLSPAEKIKVELVGALLHNPQVLLVDEPTIGLDIVTKQKVRRFLREVKRKNNMTLFLAGADMDEVESICDRVIVMNKGTKIFDGALSDLNGRYKGKKYVKFTFNHTPRVISLDLKENIELAEKGDNYYLYKTSSETMPRLISEITTNYELLDIDIIAIPLEEIITDILGKS